MYASFFAGGRAALCAAGLLALLLGLSHPVRADIVGRLRVAVKDAETGAPLRRVDITLRDTAGIRADIGMDTDVSGAALSPPLENRAWQIITQRPGYDSDTRIATVAADNTVEVTVLLRARVQMTGTTTVTFSPRSGTTTSARRDLSFARSVPATAGNPQSLNQLLATVPGFIPDSNNIVHPRAEHSSVTIYIDGFQLPGVLQGKAGTILSPSVIQNADIQTGGYAPEYGSETGAILNFSLRSGPIAPLAALESSAGGDSTYYGETSFGGQAGAPLSAARSGSGTARRFRYFVDLSSRSTANAIEPPQPDDQTAHNSGVSSTAFGNFDYLAGARDHITLTVSGAPAHTEIANRTGLGSGYAAVGENYGYGGARNADGNVPGGDPSALGGQRIVLPSQQAAGQDDYQVEDSSFGVLALRHTFAPRVTGLLSVGLTHSRLDLQNHNPTVDFGSRTPDGALSQIDNSIEYNPTALRSYDQGETLGSVTSTQGAHTVKAGFVDDEQRGRETYQFIPASQLALDALAGIDTRLAPAGTALTDPSGRPVLDVLGNQVYLLSPGAVTPPTLHVRRSGYYRAAYLQDTWRAGAGLTVNYGLRFDSYRQAENLGNPPVSKSDLSPRFNLALQISRDTLLRASFDHLFSQPPLAQGAILGLPIQPQTQNQYEIDIERRVAAHQVARIAYFAKDTRNSFDTSVLIPFTQIGAFSTVNFTSDSTHGTEVSYDLTPSGAAGFSAYLAWSNMLSKDGGVDNLGGPAPMVKDHDQRNTISVGAGYAWTNGAVAGLEVDYGSGETVSEIASAFFGTALNGGARTPHTQVNLRLASPRFGATGVAVKLDIENLFDERHALDFNSGFSGTRFEQGRRALFGLTRSF